MGYRKYNDSEPINVSQALKNKLPGGKTSGIFIIFQTNQWFLSHSVLTDNSWKNFQVYSNSLQ